MISNVYANKILNLMCGASINITFPGTVYLGLSASAPDSYSGAVTGEPTAASYSRTIVGGTNATNSFGEAEYGKITNNKEIQFKTAREAWGHMYYFFLSESAKGAAFLWGVIKKEDEEGNVEEGINIPAETVPTFYEGDLVISLDVPLE